MKAIELASENNEEFNEVLSEIMAEDGAESIQDLSISTLKSIIENNNLDVDLTAAGETIKLYMKADRVLDLTDEGTDVGDVETVWKRLHEAGLVDDAWSSLDKEAIRELEDDYNGKTIYTMFEREGVYAKAYTKGYDAVAFMDVSPDGEVHATWVADKAAQYKSASPVTYDDQGKVIPLSQRFQEEKEDIRFSIASEAVAPKAGAEAEEKKRTIEDYLKGVGKTLRRTSEKRQLVVSGKYENPLASENPEVERRIRAARGIGRPNMLLRTKEALREIASSMTRHFPYLAKGDEKAANIFRVYQEIPNYSKYSAADMIRNIVDPLNKEEYEAYTRIILLDDLLKDVESGMYENKDIPFGYKNKSEIIYDLEKFRDIARSNPAVITAINDRKSLFRSMVQKQVDNGLLPEKVLENERYYHHQVLEKVRERQAAFPGVSSSDVRTHKKGYQRSRTGSSLDYNTDYFESEFEVLAQGLSQLATIDTLNRIKDEYDISGDLKQQARDANMALLLKMDPTSDDVLKGFRKRIAMAGSKLASMAQNGELTVTGFDDVLEDLSTPYEEEREGEIYTTHGGVEPERYFPFLNALLDQGEAGAIQAGAIYRAIHDRAAYIKKTLGQKYKTYRDMVPEGMTLWQPKEGNSFHRVNTLSDRIIGRVLAGEKTLEESDIKQAMAIGGRLPEWVLPEGVAKTLDQFQTYDDKWVVAKAAKWLLDSWKQYVLLNPMRASKYNMNNFSGDLDIVLAYNPKILKYSWAASKDLYNFNVKKKTASAEMEEALRLGVIDAGLTVQEIPDIKDTGFFRVMTGEKEGAIQKYWNTVRDYTRWRENILRLSAYRFFKNEIAAGRNPVGASNANEVYAISDPNERAAKLARELMGDYGNISKGGQWLRAHLIPFYSWIEVNAPRYYRLMKNIPLEEGNGGIATRTGAVIAKKAAMKGVGLAVRMQIFYSAVALWNHIFFPDEEEELYEGRRQLHLILGRNDDGLIRSVRIQGAFSDMLNWIGAHDYPMDIADLLSGRTDWAELGKEAYQAFANKLIQGVTPLIKTPVELISGQTYYPDVFKPRPIRDRWEQVARLFSLELPYKKLTGKPMRKGETNIGQIVSGLLTYTSDPGELAYFETIRLRNKFIEQHEDTPAGWGMTEKSKALYNYRRAKTFGDEKATAKYSQKYIDLGGKKINIHMAEIRQHPVQNIKAEYRKRFMDSLSPRDLKAVERGIQWYQRMYDMEKEQDPWLLYIQAKLGERKLSDEEKGIIKYATMRTLPEDNPKWIQERIQSNLEKNQERWNRISKEIDEIDQMGE
jgi:ASC-1-like (ASCH) protein